MGVNGVVVNELQLAIDVCRDARWSFNVGGLHLAVVCNAKGAKNTQSKRKDLIGSLRFLFALIAISAVGSRESSIVNRK